MIDTNGLRCAYCRRWKRDDETGSLCSDCGSFNLTATAIFRKKENIQRDGLNHEDLGGQNGVCGDCSGGDCDRVDFA